MKSQSLQNSLAWFKQTRSYSIYLLLTFLFWLPVPAFSKIGVARGELTGLQMVFWVNFFATLVIYPLYQFTQRKRRTSQLKSGLNYSSLKLKDYLSMVGLAFFWPFLFSIGYFVSIDLGSPTITSIINRTSILIYAPLSVYVFKRRGEITIQDLIIMAITLVSVLIATSNDLKNSLFAISAILLAILAAVTDGLKTAFSEEWKDKYDPLYMILIFEVTTLVLSFITLLILGKEFVPLEKKVLLYPLFIGIFSNAFGFWLSTEGFQKATRLTDKSHKTLYLITQSGILFFTQIVLISLLNAELIDRPKWIGSLILTSGLIWYSFKKSKKNPVLTPNKIRNRI